MMVSVRRDVAEEIIKKMQDNPEYKLVSPSVVVDIILRKNLGLKQRRMGNVGFNPLTLSDDGLCADNYSFLDLYRQPRKKSIRREANQLEKHTENLLVH